MSTKASRKSKCPKPLEPIVTRTKSAQQRQQTNKKQKSEKPEKPKLTKVEIKSPKSKKNSICNKDSLLKKSDKKTDEIIDQVEYYPNKLKRDLCNKKVVLKPKHNFKVIATANKRKLAIPKKGIKPDSENSYSPVPELSIQDMVRMMDETRSLSDEDFMEILTCPSPVWWEDPPDGTYYEDSLYRRSPEPRSKTPIEFITISPEPPPKKKTKNTSNKKSKVPKINKNPGFVKQTQDKEQIINKKDVKFVKKQLKLENILGNIKNKTQVQKEKKDEINENVKKRKLSESTEGDISDLSFNEEIIKNIETMVIPMEKTSEVEIIDDKEDIQKEIKKELIDETPQVIKPEIKDEMSVKSSNIDTENINNSVVDDVISFDSQDSTSLSLNDDSNSSEDFSIAQDNIKRLKDKIKSKFTKNTDTGNPYKKIINDLTEYITVYKIIPEKAKAELNAENVVNTENNTKTKLDTARGKLNEFFKHCKSNKRLKKPDSPIPAIPLTDVKKETTDNEKENDVKTELEERNPLKCDHCVEKTVNGETVLSCEKRELDPILPCDLCNFLAENKELYKKHVSTCKEIERISWNSNLVLNQT